AQNLQTRHSYHGPRFETFAMALEAARVGCGVALVPRFLASRELDKEELIIPWNFAPRSEGSYYLAYPENKRELSRVVAFVDWVRSRLPSPDAATDAADKRAESESN